MARLTIDTVSQPADRSNDWTELGNEKIYTQERSLLSRTTPPSSSLPLTILYSTRLRLRLGFCTAPPPSSGVCTVYSVSLHLYAPPPKKKKRSSQPEDRRAMQEKRGDGCEANFPPFNSPALAKRHRQPHPPGLPHPRPPEILIQIQDNLQRVPRPQIRHRRPLLPQPTPTPHIHTQAPRLRPHRRTLGRAPRHRQRLLQHLVRREREAELRTRPQDPRGPALEESAEAFFLVDGAGAVAQTGVFGLALAGFDLQTGLDDVAGGGEVRGGHTGDGARGEELHDAESLVGAFAEEVALQVVVGGEVDGGEGDVAEEAGGGAFVEADQAEVLDDPHGGAAGDVGGFSDLALDLQPNFDDFEGVGENLLMVRS